MSTIPKSTITWETPTVIWIPGVIGTRLAERLRADWDPIVAVSNGDELQRMTTTMAIERVIVAYSDDWEQHQQFWRDVPHVALLLGNVEPPSDWQDARITLLTGPLPNNVIAWMRKCDMEAETQVDAAQLPWDEHNNATHVEPAVPFRPERPIVTNRNHGGDTLSLSRPLFNSRILAFFSTAGGVGKTTSTSVIARLLRERGRRVAIVEADEEKAGILRMFGMPPALQGLDSIPEMIWPDPEALSQKLEQIAVPLAQRGLPEIVIYPFAGALDGIQVPSREVFGDFLLMLQKQYDYVLVDLGPRLRDEMTLGTLNVADTVLLVYGPTEVDLDAALRHMQNVEEMARFSRDKYRLILNKVEESSKINPRAVANTLNLPVLGMIPNDAATYHQMANTGRIALPADSPWRDIFVQLMNDLAESPEPSNSAQPTHSAKADKNAKPHWIRRVLGLH